MNPLTFTHHEYGTPPGASGLRQSMWASNHSLPRVYINPIGNSFGELISTDLLRVQPVPVRPGNNNLFEVVTFSERNMCYKIVEVFPDLASDLIRILKLPAITRLQEGFATVDLKTLRQLKREGEELSEDLSRYVNEDRAEIPDASCLDSVLRQFDEEFLRRNSAEHLPGDDKPFSPLPWVAEMEEASSGKGIAICSQGDGVIMVILPPEGTPLDDVDRGNAQLVVGAVNVVPQMVAVARDMRELLKELSLVPLTPRNKKRWHKSAMGVLHGLEAALQTIITWRPEEPK